MASLADVDAYVKDPFAFVTVPVKDYAAMKAVIKAARAYSNADVQTYDEKRIALEDAVEALERAEGVSDDTQTAIADFENEGGIIPEDEK